MSVLAEAISVIVNQAALEDHYPGGARAFALDAPPGTFCSDGLLARAGFLAMDQAEYFAALLGACGLRAAAAGGAADWVVVDRNLGPLQPCLWIEFAHDRRGIPLCWHAAARRGALCAPAGWEPPAAPVGQALGRAFSSQVRRLRSERNLEWYCERQSGRVFSAPRPFIPH